MPMIAKWATKIWEVSERRIVSLSGLSFSYSQVADNNSATEENKPTNERGTELFPLSFTMSLHSGAGVDVRAEIESWERLVTKVDYFYLGGKRLGPKLQLRSVSVGNVEIDGFGRMLFANLSIEFKEYDATTSSVTVNTTAIAVSPSADDKAQNAPENPQIKSAETKTITVGSYVKPVGTKYSTGKTIPDWVKNQSHIVSKINESQNLVLLGANGGINSWVYLSEVTLV